MSEFLLVCRQSTSPVIVELVESKEFQMVLLISILCDALGARNRPSGVANAPQHSVASKFFRFLS